MMQQYAKYKDSGVDWLGEIPEGWNLVRIGSRFQERREKVSDKDFEPLSVTKNGILPQLANAAKTNDGDNRKLVKKGDFVINSRSDRKGSSGIAKQDGSVSLINIVMEPKGIDPSFCNQLLKSKAFVEEYYRMGHGIVADLWTTRYSEMKAVLLALPPLPEQTAIAEFLDDKTAKINELVEIKRRQIALLAERKQILIQNAVTKGLNPNAPMKDSGVDWIGKIPAHWEVVSVRRVLNDIEQGSSPPASNTLLEKDQASVIKISAIKQGLFRENEAKPIEEGRYEKCYQIREGDLLVTRGNTPELVADVCVVRDEPNTRLMISDLVYRLIPNSLISKTYLCYFLLSSLGRYQIQRDARGSSMTMAKVSQSHIKSWLVTLPPVGEHNKITEFITTQTQKIDTAITLKQNQITKLTEYKTTLINAAVTGKIKVTDMF